MPRRLIIPTSLRLRGQLVRVELADPPTDADGDLCAGYYDEAAKRIVVNPSLDEREREVALVHEILHACMPGKSREDPIEEAIVEALDEPLLEAIRQLRWTR